MLEPVNVKVGVQHDRTTTVILALAVVLIRVAYKAAGLRFDAQPMTWFWQFLDLDQLSRNLGQALLYLHMQPPGLNVLAGVGTKLFGPAAPRIYELLFGAAGLAMDIALFWLIVRFSGNRPLAWAVTLLVAANPVFIVYENHLFNTHLVATLMIVALFLLERTVTTGRIGWLLGYGLTLLAITLFRSMFHPLWWLALFPLGLLGVKPGRRSVAMGAILFLAVLAWPLKNYSVVDRFTSSTWLGMNLYNTVYNQSFTADEMRRYYDGEPRPNKRPAGARSEISFLAPFSKPERYSPAISPASSGVPVLDAPYRQGGMPNYNSLVYLQASDLYLQDYIDVVRADPTILIRVFRSSLRAFFRPATDHEVLLFDQDTRDNLRDFHGLLTWYDIVFYWRLASTDRDTSVGRAAGVSPALVLGYLVALAWCPWRIVGTFRCDRMRAAVLSFVWLNAVYVLLVGNFFENYENMRFRFEIEALIVLACAFALGDLLARLRPAAGAAARPRGGPPATPWKGRFRTD